MAKLRYGRSYWLARPGAARAAAWPRHRGHLDTTVAVVGGGLTGCLVAYSFAAAGVRVALLEAARLGMAGTAGSVGVLVPEPPVDFQAVREAYGLRAARGIWQASRRATLDLAATLRRLEIRCDLATPGGVRVATTAEAAARLRRESQARRAAGLEAPWLTPRVLRAEFRLDAGGGVRLPEAATVDPVRAARGMARAARRRGALVFERSPVRRVAAGRRAVEITTDGGTVRAERVVIATGAPGALYRPLARHFRTQDRFAVLTAPLPAAVRRETAARPVVLQDTATPPHTLRWVREERLLFAGADRPAVPARQLPKVLVQRAGQLMYELSLLYPAISGLPAEFAWRVPVVVAKDGMPVIGPHRYYARHLFAWGFGADGIGFAHLAARICVRAFFGEPARADELFSFARLLRERGE